MLDIVFAGLVAYCGIFAGIILTKLSQDEIIIGKIHFDFLYSISVLIYLITLIFSQTSYLVYIIVLLCAITFFFKKEYYQMLYVTFPFALVYTNNTLLISILFFIIGLIITSREMSVFAKNKKLAIKPQLFYHMFAKTFYFFPALIVLFL